MGVGKGKGSRRKSPNFVMLYHSIIDTPGFQGLGGNAAKLLVIICRHYDGSNNGNILLTERQAADAMGCVRNTASAAFKELEDAGFVTAHKRGGFDPAKPTGTMWRLTFWPAFGRAPTRDFDRR